MNFLFVDIDGVLINGFHYDEKKRFVWYKNIDMDLGISYQQIASFFSSRDFTDALVGKENLKTVLNRYFEKNMIYFDVEEFISYWFTKDSHLNLDVLKSIIHIKADRKYLVTIQEQYRANYLWEVLGLKKYFDGIFYSGDIGYLKDESEFYLTINQRLDIDFTKDSVRYIDDNPKFVKIASENGWNSTLFKGKI